MSYTSDDMLGTEVAIIGMAGRFPGARNLDEFWKNLAGGVESIAVLSDEELLAAGISPAHISDPNYVKARGVLQDSEWFDASFFGFTPKLADILDPQHRIFLECASEALESAGCDPQRYDGLIGVYAGKSMSSYFSNNLSSRPDVLDSVDELEVLVANDKDHLTTSVSYKLGLRGPSVTVQTACSTSLVAVHMACQSLIHRECDMALAGGVSIVYPQSGYFYREGGIRSPDGHCRAFDASARGTVGGSGAGVVLLKNLRDALEDGDPIHAIIRGSASNNDGAQKVGYTAPGVAGQSDVIAEALAMAGVDVQTITYVETHGTGTNLGDPVEIGALTKAFRGGTSKTGFCAVGSLKTNIGHLDTAAGVAGLIKTVLALENKSIPASLHFKQPNPKIDFDNSPFFVNSKLAEWRSGPTPRRAGVSSFGMGGTNAHVILEEAPTPAPTSISRPSQLFVLSAKTPTALDLAAGNLAEFLREHPESVLADAAYTLQVGRRVFPHRRIVVGQDRLDTIAALESRDAAAMTDGFHEGTEPQVVFLFAGQGAQRPNMGLELYRTERTFRRHLNECCDGFEAHTGRDLRPILYPDEINRDQAARLLRQTDITQPALFAFEYALAKLWMAWGIHPQAMIGHSIGEYVAACLAGVFSLDDTMALVAERGRLMSQLPRGYMISIPLAQADVTPLLTEGLSIAALNGPQLSVVAGSKQAVDDLESALTQLGVNAHRLHTSHAFHSAMMDPIIEPYAERVRQVPRSKPTIPFISNVTGSWITAEEAVDSSYWANHIRQTVQFSSGLEQLFAQPDRILLEIGPAATVSSMARRHPAKPRELTVLSSLPHANRLESEAKHLLLGLGQLWLKGCKPDWSSFYANEKRRRTSLPTYPFERQRYWVSPSDVSQTEITVERKPVTDWFFEPSWQRRQLPSTSALGNLRWLLFADEQGIASEMAKSLASCDCDVVIVSSGSRFSRPNERDFIINPSSRQDYDRLIAELLESGEIPNRLVHLWSVTEDSQYQTDPDLFAQRQSRGYYSLLYLVQALSDGLVADSLDLTVVTNQVQDVNGQESLCPDKATVLGPAITIGVEFPNITCRSVDVSLAGPQDAVIQAQNLISEATSADATDLIVAYRAKYRWIQTFQPSPLHPVSGCPGRLREGGRYLITGGMGGMGLALAEYLAQTVRAELVLVGRTGLPDKELWDEYLSQQNPDSVGEQIRKLRAIEENGGKVLICRADVSDRRQMSEVLAKANDRFGGLDGVIHAAGIPGGGVLLHQTPATVEEVFSAKIVGTLVLDELFKDHSLDFMVLCSSRLSFLGAPGRSEYSAAHKFMDLFGRQLAASSERFVTVINWDTWQEVGMAVQSRMEQDGTRQEVRPEFGMTTHEGVEVFARILSSEMLQVAVSLYGLQPDASRSNIASPSRMSPAREQQPAQAFHPRPQVQTAYEAPRTDLERTLAGIWRQVSGIDTIGIQDNFFELGGDSIIALQIVAKANQAGLKLTARHILELQTIAELASVVGTGSRIEAEQGVVTGPVPLTPIQKWFFEKDLPEPQYFNQSVLLKELQPLDHGIVRQAVRHLLEHHDALRLRHQRTDTGWSQVVEDPGNEGNIHHVDLSGLSGAEQKPAIEAAASQLQRSLGLSEGPLLRVAYLDLGPNRQGRWLFVIHHLAVDIVSWSFLLEDMQTAYEALRTECRVSLPPKTVSFKQWSEHLNQYAQSSGVVEELDYWLSLGEESRSALPVDRPGGANTYGSIEEISVSLTPEETQALLQQARTTYNAQVDDLLLTATSLSLSEWTGQTSLFLDMEGHGREEFISGIDVSRTLGWFTTLYPVALKLDAGVTPDEAVKRIKEQLRAVPHHGMNYGVLRYLNVERQIAESLKNDSPSEVGFLYLGAADQTGSLSSLFGPADESAGLGQDLNNVRPHLIEIVAKVDSERLKVFWTFSRNLHRRETIKTLSQRFMQALRSLIDHGQRPEAAGCAPSDFPLAKLDQRSQDRLIGSSREVEDIYPLSPMQQGLLFHSLYNSESSVYCQRVGRTFYGHLDVQALQKAWQTVVDRHPVLRSTFRWEDLDQPLQVVHRHVGLSWRQEDWRELSADEQKLQQESFIESDQYRCFDLKQAPLMRLSLFRLADNVHYFHWSFHHLLLDGWCINLVVKEVFDFFQSYCENKDLRLKLPRPYRDYIAWLKAKDLSKAEEFWRERLAGLACPTSLYPAGPNNYPADKEKQFDSQEVRFSASKSEKLLTLTRRNRLTLSTVFQGAWSLLLSQRSGLQDIVFGSVVSGHSAEIEGMESMVGLFMNTLPMRVCVPPGAKLLTWLQEFQSRHAELREYDYTPLVDLQRWSQMDARTPLFESIVSFRNQPLKTVLQQSQAKLQIQTDPFLNPSHYPLTVEGNYGDTLWFRIVYDRSCFDRATIEELAGQFESYLSAFAARLDSNLQIGNFLAAVDREYEVRQEELLADLSKGKLKRFNRSPR